MSEQREPELDAPELLGPEPPEPEQFEEIDLNDCNDWECNP